jgi:acetoin utilization deacetylase AcuC-like enzyme
VIDDFEPWYWFWFSGSTQESIQLAHPEKYFDKIESIYEEVDGQPSNKKAIWFGSDTYVNTHTANAARLAVQGTLIALEKVLSNSWANAFAAVRPPGHHSGHVTSPNGFCIYNNVAIGRLYL